VKVVAEIPGEISCNADIPNRQQATDLAGVLSQSELESDTLFSPSRSFFKFKNGGVERGCSAQMGNKPHHHGRQNQERQQRASDSCCSATYNPRSSEGLIL
jgi:hypothetical protein